MGMARRMFLRIHGRHLLPAAILAGASVSGLFLTTAAAGPASASTSGSQIAPLTTVALPPSYVTPGQQLFEENCSSCHGVGALGTDHAPDLVGVGSATVDFWVSTGRMPLAIGSIQAAQKPSKFDRTQTLQIAAFIASLSSPSGVQSPGIPNVNLQTADIADGQSLFVLNCAACHTITGAGDALTNGAYAPSLHVATATQVAEAIRTGPANMPTFGPGNITNQQVADIVAYVTGPIQNPNNHGGSGLGGVGPVAEGFIALLIGVGGLALIAFWIGDRA